VIRGGNWLAKDLFLEITLEGGKVKKS